MDVNTRNRAELKSYFVKNSIPTESNFAELVDGMLNQKDDGLVKLPGNPLTIEAAGDSNSEKKVLNIGAGFQAHPGHAHRFFNTFFIVNHIILWHHMDNLATRGHYHPIHILCQSLCSTVSPT